MIFKVIVVVPQHRNALIPSLTVPEKIQVSDIEVENIDELREKLELPLGSYALVMESDLVLTIRPRIVNQVTGE